MAAYLQVRRVVGRLSRPALDPAVLERAFAGGAGRPKKADAEPPTLRRPEISEEIAKHMMLGAERGLR